MEAFVTTLVLCTIGLGLVGTSFACNGYQLKVNHIKNCVPHSVIKLDNLNVMLDNDCNIITTGCVITTKRFETAQAHYILSKPPLPAFEGDTDVCDNMEQDHPEGREIQTVFNLPKQCPVNAGKVCSGPNSKISISKYKNRLALVAGTISFKSNITHNTGVSCIDINLTLEKPRRG